MLNRTLRTGRTVSLDTANTSLYSVIRKYDTIIYRGVKKMKVLGWIMVVWGVLSFAGQGQYADGSAENTLPLFGSIAIFGIGIYLIRTAKKNKANK